MKISVALTLLVLLCGCSSNLNFSVKRYDIDACKPESKQANYKCDTRNEYEKIHPPHMTLAERAARLDLLRESLKSYKNYLLGLNQIVQVLFDQDPVKKDKVIEDQSLVLLQTIDENTRETMVAIGKYGYNSTQAIDSASIFIKFEEMKAMLQKSSVVIDEESLSKTIKALESLGGETLKKKIVGIKTKFAALAGSEEKQIALKIAEQIEKLEFAQVASDMRAAITPIKENIENIRPASGDLARRLHKVYQDLSDPYWGIIASHNDQWMQLPNSATVSGEGDNEFIFVFEDNLDGRWKRVTVDPTKIVKARLRIARKATSAVTGLIGVAAKAYGVPIPQEIQKNADSQPNNQIDFSIMTAQEQFQKKDNQRKKMAIRDLQAYAESALTKLNAGEQPDLLLEQYIRRLSRIVPK